MDKYALLLDDVKIKIEVLEVAKKFDTCAGKLEQIWRRY